MFFQGSLQEGISTALQQSKLVVCFVTDKEAESQQWETEFLADDSLKTPLESQAVVLRLVAGSQEAGFLEALFPVPKKPTVVIIQNGQLKEYLHAGTPKEDFVRRVGTAFAAPSSHSQPQPSPTPVQQDTLPQASQAPMPTPSETDDNLYDDDYPPAPAVAIPSATTSATEQGAQQESQAVLAEREKKKLEAEKKAKARAEAEAEARRQTDERCKPCNPEPNYAEKVKQRKLKGDDERRRILKRIEDDKRERKQREAEERKARQLLSANPESEAASSETAPIPLSRRQPTGSKGEFCNLQVRLLDGTTIRTRFPSDKTLRTDVRKWIDEERTDGDSPYTFRVVLTPLPNKMIEQSEETQSLLSLGLAPSATLVLVPSRYVRAFSQSSGNVTRGVGSFFGLFISIYAAIIGALGGVFGMLFGRRSSTEEGIPLETMNTSRNSRIRGFQNPDDRQRDAQLYNGNSLNFEPRRDEDGEEDN